MLKHSKVRTTKTNRQIERSKSLSHNTFKSSLLILTSIIMFLSLLIIAFVIIRGIMGAGQVIEEGEGSWLFGNKYDGAVYFAAGFMLVNTIWTTIISIVIAVPISVLTALFITRVAPKSTRTFFFVTLSILAAIPSVIYGAFGNRVVDEAMVMLTGASIGSLLSIVVTLSFMIMPTITLITTTSINSIDKRMEDSSLALGATRNQTSFYITIRAAMSGIITATILGVGRALGEATAVSMISVDPYVGPTFGLLGQIRLLTATMLKGYNEMAPGSIQQASMFAMGMLLIISILLVFLSMRYFQKHQDPSYKAKRASKKIFALRELENKVDEIGLERMTIKDQKKYAKLERKHELQELVDDYYHRKYEKEMIIKDTTIKSTNATSKENKSKLLGGLTWGVACIGVVFLASIILFLITLGFNGLSWDYISSSNEWESTGLSTAIFGTLVMIGLSLLFIIPLGVSAGIYFSTFAKKNRFTNFLTTSIDILTGIPSLIFGLVGMAIFLPLAKVIGFTPLAGAIVLTLIVVPTVIQTTQEAVKSVPTGETQGSLALGSTRTSATLRISLPQSLPQIIAGIVLAIGRIIGESAALVMVFGTTSRGTAGEWLNYGGTTLATEMYRLTLLEAIPWDQVAAIGLVILSLILMLSLLSNYISHKNWYATLGVLLSLILLLSGIFLGYIIGLLLFILGLVLLVGTIITNSILERR